MQRDARVEECQVTQAVGQSGVVVDCGGEYRGIGPEGDDRTGVVALAFDAQLCGGLAAAVLLHVALAVAVHFGMKNESL